MTLFSRIYENNKTNQKRREKTFYKTYLQNLNIISCGKY